jgi:hypothetical protein
MVASSPAATVLGIPWSLAAGMKWVPISPFVVIPQIAKLPASSQKAGMRAPIRSPSNAAQRRRGAPESPAGRDQSRD